MKNRIADVRDHLVAMMEALGDTPTDAAAAAATVERAKALAGISAQYIASVKVEIDARRLLAESGGDRPPPLRAAPLLPGESS